MTGSRRSSIDEDEQYVSRAAYKLESIAADFGLDFKGKVVLDVGSSTGGFSDYALKHGASLVIAVEKGTNQMDSGLRLNDKIELHEKTDIREFNTTTSIDMVLIDVSFISLKEILPSISHIISKDTQVIAMAKPQFETKDESLKNRGVIKNERLRRQILSELEKWLRPIFVIKAKSDSKITGVKGNKERFYLLSQSK
jgi:23S rRNA (cytidine1920-2'-O)/16S rRNA (cytidine1409-2'-O)-methyltransferase